MACCRCAWRQSGRRHKASHRGRVDRSGRSPASWRSFHHLPAHSRGIDGPAGALLPCRQAARSLPTAIAASGGPRRARDRSEHRSRSSVGEILAMRAIDLAEVRGSVRRHDAATEAGRVSAGPSSSQRPHPSGRRRSMDRYRFRQNARRWSCRGHVATARRDRRVAEFRQVVGDQRTDVDHAAFRQMPAIRR